MGLLDCIVAVAVVVGGAGGGAKESEGGRDCGEGRGDCTGVDEGSIGDVCDACDVLP